MAEALGVTASIIAVSAFAGQLAQGAASLYQIFHAYQDAPKGVQRLSTEIKLMGSILAHIEASFNDPTETPDPDFCHILRLCEDAINDLTQSLTKLGTTQVMRTRKKVMKRVKFSLGLSDLAKHTAVLERAKSMLLQYCAAKSKIAQVATSKTLDTLQSSVDDARQAAITAGKAVDDTRQAFEALKQPLLGINLAATETQKSVASLLESNARIENFQQKTYTAVDKLELDTLDMREDIRAMRSISQDIANQVMNGHPELMQALRHDIQQAITLGIRDLREDIRQERVTLQPQVACYPCSSRIQALDYDTEQSSGLKTQALQSQIMSTSLWVRRSTTVSWNPVARRTIFGTVFARTVNTQYVRTSSKDAHETEEETEVRNMSRTTITFLPAAWLCSSGATFQYGAIVNPAPRWSLRSVNIVSEQSEIMTACRNLDIFRVRELFEAGKASPFDVDEHGRNLLGFLALGSRILPEGVNKEAYMEEDIEDRLERLLALLEMLLSHGVDPSDLEVDTTHNPLTLFVDCWFEFHNDVGELYGDHLRKILSRMLSHAKSDPLVPLRNIWANPCRNVYAANVEEPRMLAIELAPMELELLANQDDWCLPWAQHKQLRLMCSLGWDGAVWADDVREFVGYWVTSTHEEVEKYLERKAYLIQIVVQNAGKLCPRDWEDLLHVTIHGGGEVIALLSEHSFGDQGSPWLLHRFRKLVVVRNHLIHTLKMLLRQGGKSLADPQLLDRVSEHARRHNARTFSSWRTAVEEAGQSVPEAGHDGCSSQGLDGIADEWGTDSSGASDSDSDSAWETEEEWEEGYSLQTAIDRGKQVEPMNNPEVCSCGGHRGADIDPNYNEDYWEHVYSRILGQDYDSPPQLSPRESAKKIKAVAREVRDFISFIV